MADTVGEAYVKIVADSRGLNKDVEKLLAKQADQMERAGKQNASRFNKGFRDEIEGNEGLDKSIIDGLQTEKGKVAAAGSLLGDDFRKALNDSLQRGDYREPEFIKQIADSIHKDLSEAARRGALDVDNLSDTLRNSLVNAEESVVRETKKMYDEQIKWAEGNDRMITQAHALNKAFDTKQMTAWHDEALKANQVLGSQADGFSKLQREAEKMGTSLSRLNEDYALLNESTRKGETSTDAAANRMRALSRASDDLGAKFKDLDRRTREFGRDLDRSVARPGALAAGFRTLRSGLGDLETAFGNTERRLSSFRNQAKKPWRGLEFGGILGHFQEFGQLLLHSSIDITQWRKGVMAAAETMLGFGKVVSKVGLLLGPIAGGLSSLTGIVTAFAGSIQTGLIGAFAAIGPMAVAAGASMLVLSMGMKAFGRDATAAQKKMVKPLTDQLTKLQTAVQKTLFKNIGAEAKALGPVLKVVQSGLVGVAQALRGTVLGLTQVLGKTGQAGESFKTLMTSLKPLSASLGKALTNVISGLVGSLATAVPTAQKFGDALVRLTDRFAKFANSTKGKSTMADYFDRGYQAASKILTILGTLGAALFKVLDLGDKRSGESFLDSMLKSVQHFDAYVSSAKGVQDLKGWFDDARYAAASLGRALGAVGKAFGALDVSQTRDQFRDMVDFSAKLVTGFAGVVTKLQALTSSVSPLGSAASGAWDNIKKLGATLIDIFKRMEDSGAGVLTSALNILGGAAGLANTALRAMQPIINLLVTAFTALPAPMQQVIGALLVMQKIGAFAAINKGVTSLTTSMAALSLTAAGTERATTGIGSAAAGVGSKMKLFAKSAGSAAFGPVGLAIAGVSIGLGLLAMHQKKAAEAAAEHKKEVDTLTKSMQEQGAASGAMVTKTTSQMLADKGAFKIARDLGIQYSQVLEATQKNGAARSDLAKRTNEATTASAKMHLSAGQNTQSLTDLAKATKDGSSAAGDAAAKTDANAKKYSELSGIVNKVAGDIDDANAQFLEQAQSMAAMGDATSSVNPMIQDLTKQMNTFADSTQSASTRTDAFATALNDLTDKSMSTEDAAIKAAEAHRQMAQTFGATRDAAGKLVPAQANIAKAFKDGTVQIDTNSTAAATLADNMRNRVVPAFADTVRAAFDAAGGVKDLGPATIAASDAAKKYGDDLRKQFMQLGLTRDQAQSLIDKYHLMPDDVITLSKLLGGKATETQLGEILKKAKDVTTNPVTLRADASNAVAVAAKFQATIDRIKQGKVPGLSADSAKGKAVIADMQGKINRIRQATATRLAANPDAANKTVLALQARLDRIIQKHPTALKANSDPAHATATALLGEINAMHAQVNVGADMSEATTDVSKWRPPPATMKVYAEVGKQYSKGNYMAGGIVDKPTHATLGERSYREAVIPLDLPINRVDPSVRAMSALLRGGAGSKSNNNGQQQPQRVYHVNLTVNPAAADPEAVATSVLNRLTVIGG